MQVIKADIWTYHPTHWIVIPTNIGWKRNGENVMGRGLAAQAAKRFPGLAFEYGAFCRMAERDRPLPVMIDDMNHLLMFPVKPLAKDPALSWKQKASLPLIEDSAKDLSFVIRGGFIGKESVAMPMVGCGNGGLKREDVLPILERHLGDLPNLILVDQA